MAVTTITGAQWGDEGKGKIIDIMAQKADVVVRAQGGDNAGHTIVVNGQTYKLHLVPSGILYPKALCVIACGTVVNPQVLLGEMESLASRGISLDGLKIDERAHVIFPYHIELDRLSEQARGDLDIGTTKKGIGPCYMDKAARTGIRVCDLLLPSFKDRLREELDYKNKLITCMYGGKPLELEEIYDKYIQYANALRPHICDTSVLIYNAIKAGKDVLFEGAQGALLDLDVGTYPFVTSSNPTSGGFCIGSGIGPTLINESVGIAKAYTTRVGKGPFPTELNDEIGTYIRETGLEFGTTTGRARRCGWLDLVILRFAVRINGLTQLVVNKLDTLSGIDTLKICVAYKYKGQVIRDFPSDISQLAECEPIYKEFKGFKENISECTSYFQLPDSAKAYIEFIEKEIDCRISMVGVGSARTQSLVK